MDGVDAVLALLRGCRDVNVLREVTGVLELDLQGVGDDRRRILREISKVIDSEDEYMVIKRRNQRGSPNNLQRKKPRRKVCSEEGRGRWLTVNIIDALTIPLTTYIFEGW